MPDTLNALRSADPARHFPAATPAQLEAARSQIDTPAMAPPSRTRRIPRRALVGILFLAGAGSVAVAAVVQPWARDETRQAGPGTRAEDATAVFAREWTDATAALDLPPGVAWPKQTAPADTIFGTGRGGLAESMAVGFALTSWQCELVRADGQHDRAAVAAAASALNTLIDNNIVEVPEGTPEDGAAPSDIPGPIAQYAPGDESVKTMFKRQVANGVAGDVTDLRSSCQANS